MNSWLQLEKLGMFCFRKLKSRGSEGMNVISQLEWRCRRIQTARTDRIDGWVKGKPSSVYVLYLILIMNSTAYQYTWDVNMFAERVKQARRQTDHLSMYNHKATWKSSKCAQQHCPDLDLTLSPSNLGMDDDDDDDDAQISIAADWRAVTRL